MTRMTIMKSTEGKTSCSVEKDWVTISDWRVTVFDIKAFLRATGFLHTRTLSLSLTNHFITPMHFTSSLLFLVSLTTSVYAQSACKSNDTDPIIGKSFDLIAVPQKAIKRDVGGTVKIVDGCKFSVSNFTVSPPCVATYWYGVPRDQARGKNYPRIVPFVVSGSAGNTLEFNLQDYKWSDMAGIYLYCEMEKIQMAKTFWVTEKIWDDESSAVKHSGGSIALILGALTAFLF